MPITQVRYISPANLLPNDVLFEIAEALQYSLDRVSLVDMEQTQQLESWRKVHHWIESVNNVRSATDPQHASAKLPDFPLSGQQLRTLQAKINTLVQNRPPQSDQQTSHGITIAKRWKQSPSAESMASMSPLKLRLHQAHHTATKSSYLILGALMSVFALNIGYYLLMRGAIDQQALLFLIGGNVLLIFLSLIAWLTHFLHLGRVQMLLNATALRFRHHK